MTQKTDIKIGLVGLGTVGLGVWKHISSHRRELEDRLGARLVLHRAAVRDLKKPRQPKVAASKLTDDPIAVATDPDIDIVCELMGGTGRALEVTEAALKAGKIVVTANKALLCDHGKKLFQLAAKNHTSIYFEASVAGGIPIIKALREGLSANRFPLVYGILNGTCNYILTRMEREQKPFDTIVEDARRLGYVEADEALDLDGWDAAHKAVILTYLAHGTWVPLKKIPVEGIRGVALDDMEWARRLGYKIKLLAVIQRDFENHHVMASVQPTLVPGDWILSDVDGVFNAISVHGDIVGESAYIGRGAGQDPTASAVISDILDAAREKVLGLSPFLPSPASDLKLAPLESIQVPFYVRLTVKDRPGVLAEVADVLAQHKVSIESVLQTPLGEGGKANLVLTTHVTSEAVMKSVCTALKRRKSVLKAPFLLRIADFDQRLGD